MKTKVLTICAKGMNRSRYLAEYLKNLGYQTRYGGVESYEKIPGEAPNQVQQKDVDWADVIIITRKRLKPIFESLFKTKKRILLLDIPDLTHIGKSKETREILEKEIKHYLPL